MKISIVLSFRNEEAVLVEFIKRIRAVFDGMGIPLYELIFVNDASEDRSLALLLAARKERSDVKIINMSRQFGVPASIMAGMQHAEGDAVVYMDCDLQDPPELIPRLIDEWKKGADVVYTTREAREGDSLFRRFVTATAYRLVAACAPIAIPIDSGDFKLLSRRVVDELKKIDDRGSEIKGLVAWLGFRQVQVKYRRQERFAGMTRFRYFNAATRDAFFGLFTSFSTLPLAMPFLFSALALVATAGLVAGIYLLGLTPVVRGDCLLIVLGLLAALQFFFIGVIGVYLGRVLGESLRRPPYVIESKIGFD